MIEEGGFRRTLVGLKRVRAIDDVEDAVGFRRTLVGLKPGAPSPPCGLPCFRRTLVGLKLCPEKPLLEGLAPFQTNPRGVEALEETTLLLIFRNVSDEPSWG